VRSTKSSKVPAEKIVFSSATPAQRKILKIAIDVTSVAGLLRKHGGKTGQELKAEGN